MSNRATGAPGTLFDESKGRVENRLDFLNVRYGSLCKALHSDPYA